MNHFGDGYMYVIPDGKSLDYYRGLADGLIKTSIALKLLESEVLVTCLDDCISILLAKISEPEK